MGNVSGHVVRQSKETAKQRRLHMASCFLQHLRGCGFNRAVSDTTVRKHASVTDHPLASPVAAEPAGRQCCPAGCASTQAAGHTLPGLTQSPAPEGPAGGMMKEHLQSGAEMSHDGASMAYYIACRAMPLNSSMSLAGRCAIAEPLIRHVLYVTVRGRLCRPQSRIPSWYPWHGCGLVAKVGTMML